MSEKIRPPREKRRPFLKFSKYFARTLLHKVGGLHDVRFWRRNSFRILMYHDFPETAAHLRDNLASQCAHITRHYQVVSMTDIAQALREGKALPPNALAVTVDDGNRDFLLNGFPVFRAYKIPVTVYLVTGFLDRQLSLWWDQINCLLESSRKTSFELALFENSPPTPFVIKNEQYRQQVVSTIAYAAKRFNAQRREELLQRLSRILEVGLPDPGLPQMSPLGWSEVRELAKNGVDFGAHTVTHPMLSNIQDPRELTREIADSKRRIEDEIRRPVLHFCYPYGCWEDFNEETVRVVQESGFQTAVVAEPGLNGPDAHPFKLTRIPVDATLQKFYFQEALTGMHIKTNEERAAVRPA